VTDLYSWTGVRVSIMQAFWDWSDRLYGTVVLVFIGLGFESSLDWGLNLHLTGV
jgi:hypothetical protein